MILTSLIPKLPYLAILFTVTVGAPFNSWNSMSFGMPSSFSIPNIPTIPRNSFSSYSPFSDPISFNQPLGGIQSLGGFTPTLPPPLPTLWPPSPTPRWNAHALNFGFNGGHENPNKDFVNVNGQYTYSPNERVSVGVGPGYTRERVTHKLNNQQQAQLQRKTQQQDIDTLKLNGGVNVKSSNGRHTFCFMLNLWCATSEYEDIPASTQTKQGYGGKLEYKYKF